MTHCGDIGSLLRVRYRAILSDPALRTGQHARCQYLCPGNDILTASCRGTIPFPSFLIPDISLVVPIDGHITVPLPQLVP